MHTRKQCACVAVVCTACAVLDRAAPPELVVLGSMCLRGGGQALPFLFIYRAEAIRQGLYRCNAGQHARGKQFTYTKHVICYVCMPTGVSKRSFTGMLHCT